MFLCQRCSCVSFSKTSAIIIIIIYFLEFFTSALADGLSLEFEWQQVSSSLQDSSQDSSHSQQCCRLDSLYPSANFQVLQAFNNFFVIVPKAPITIGTIVTFMFHSFFNSLARLRYLSFFSLSFRFILWSAGTAKSTILQILFFCFLLIIMRSGLLAGIRWSVCMLKSHRSLCESFSRTGAGLCIYHLFGWSNLNFLQISQWITLPTQLCLTLYSFCANLLHWLIKWLIVYYFTSCEFFSSAWAHDFHWNLRKCLLKSFRFFRVFQLISAILSPRVGFVYPTDFQLLQSLPQIFRNHSERTNYDWYYHDPQIP